MATEYIGSAWLSINGKEVEVTKVDIKEITGKKPVKTMNKTGTLKGFTRGIAEYTVSLTAVLPIDGSDIDWSAAEDAKLTLNPLGGGRPISYLGFVSQDIGTAYTVDTEAMVDVSGFAMKKILE